MGRKEMSYYDIIGDVHGSATKLKALLGELGYRKDGSGVYRHPDRTAVFVGDLIDRGKEQLEVLQLVKPMVDAGSAQIVMGNHEFNAICWATEDPETGKPLREHSENKKESAQGFPQADRRGSGVLRRVVQDPAAVARPRGHPGDSRLLARGLDEGRPPHHRLGTAVDRRAFRRGQHSRHDVERCD